MLDCKTHAGKYRHRLTPVWITAKQKVVRHPVFVTIIRAIRVSRFAIAGRDETGSRWRRRCL